MEFRRHLLRITISVMIGLSLGGTSGLAKKEKNRTEQPVSIKREIEPFYPNWAYNNGIGEGFAKFAFYVDEQGNASEFVAIEYSHKAFADSLAIVLPKWRFEPAHKYGVPVKSVCQAYWEFLPNRPITTNALFDTGKRIDRKDAHRYRELNYHSENKLDRNIRMISFPEVVASADIEASAVPDNKVKVRCQFYVDTEGSAVLPIILECSVPQLENQILAAFKQAVFERPLFKESPAIAWMDKTYLIHITLP